MSEERDFDVIVIGCGTAGSKAAATAAGLGARVLAVDSADELGGLCILRGCMPTKTLLETAHRLHDVRDAERFGIRVAPPALEFGAHMERMRRLVARFQRAKVGGVERGGYALARAPARFVDPHTIEVGGEPRRARAVVIATGSKVRDLPVAAPEWARVYTSDDMFELEAPPARTLVLGGGAVGLEFAQWLARVGSRVTLASRSPLLHRVDVELGQELTRALAEEMDVRRPSTLAGLERAADGSLRATLRPRGGGDLEVVEVDALLNATGRVPRLDGLGLEAVGVDPDRLGELPATLEGPLPHVFLAGDVSARTAILHEANLEGAVAGRNAARVAGVLDGPLEERDPGSPPPMAVIFSDPPFASTGRSTVDCEREGIPYREATKRFPEQGRGIVVGARFGLLRVVVHAETNALLGCQVLGPRADDLIHVPATALAFGATARDMVARVPWYHPTLTEAFLEVFRALAD